MSFYEVGSIVRVYNANGLSYLNYNNVTTVPINLSVESAGIDNTLSLQLSRYTGNAGLGGYRNMFRFESAWCYAGSGMYKADGMGYINSTTTGSLYAVQYLTFAPGTGNIVGTYFTIHYY